MMIDIEVEAYTEEVNSYNIQLKKWENDGKGKKPKPPIELAICKSKLTTEDWETLTYIHEMLQLFKEATKLLEGRPDKSELMQPIYSRDRL